MRRGARVGEIAAATIGDLDETRKAWLVRAKVAKTRRARWVELPDDLFEILVDQLPAREDRDTEAALFPIGTTDRLRMAIGRACRDGGVPVFSPHDLRHRRISLLHQQGVSWAEIGARVGQRNISTTAQIYTHVLMDYREIDRLQLLGRVRAVHTALHTQTPRTGHLQRRSRTGALITSMHLARVVMCREEDANPPPRGATVALSTSLAIALAGRAVL